jgi:hypothetical protein
LTGSEQAQIVSGSKKAVRDDPRTVVSISGVSGDDCGSDRDRFVADSSITQKVGRFKVSMTSLISDSLRESDWHDRRQDVGTLSDPSESRLGTVQFSPRFKPLA